MDELIAEVRRLGFVERDGIWTHTVTGERGRIDSEAGFVFLHGDES